MRRREEVVRKLRGERPKRKIVAASNTPEHSSLSNAMPNPLANRFGIHPADAPTIDEWRNWMLATYGEKWDKTSYIFLKRFESEGVILKVPAEPEITQNFATHRSWTKTAVLSHRGVFEPEAYLGPEVGNHRRLRTLVETRPRREVHDVRDAVLLARPAAEGEAPQELPARGRDNRRVEGVLRPSLPVRQGEHAVEDVPAAVRAQQEVRTPRQANPEQYPEVKELVDRRHELYRQFISTGPSRRFRTG